MNKVELLNKIYNICGCNLVELISNFETKNSKLKLVYKDVYLNDKNDILVDVIDEITECPFTLILKDKELDIYYD